MQLPGRLIPREKPDTHCTEGWTVWAGAKNFASPEFDARTVQPVESSYPGPRYTSDAPLKNDHMFSFFRLSIYFA